MPLTIGRKIVKGMACLAVMSTVRQEGRDPRPLWLGDFIAAHGRTLMGKQPSLEVGVTHYHIPPNHRRAGIGVRLTNVKQSLKRGWPRGDVAVHDGCEDRVRSQERQADFPQ